jgi:hypothetical protein
VVHGDPTLDVSPLAPTAILDRSPACYYIKPHSTEHPGGGVVFRAGTIMMYSDFKKDAKAPDLARRLYNVDQGEPITLTGMLTGCSFVLDGSSGTLKATHIQPTAFGDGVALESHLKSLAPAATVYGKSRYGGDATMVIGCNQGGWKFYAHRLTGRQPPAKGTDSIHP